MCICWCANDINNHNNLLQGSPNSLKDPDYSSHISSFDNHYYNSMGSKLHSSANPGFINHGR